MWLESSERLERNAIRAGLSIEPLDRFSLATARLCQPVLEQPAAAERRPGWLPAFI